MGLLEMVPVSVCVLISVENIAKVRIAKYEGLGTNRIENRQAHVGS